MDVEHKVTKSAKIDTRPTRGLMGPEYVPSSNARTGHLTIKRIKSFPSVVAEPALICSL